MLRVWRTYGSSQSRQSRPPPGAWSGERNRGPEGAATGVGYLTSATVRGADAVSSGLPVRQRREIPDDRRGTGWRISPDGKPFAYIAIASRPSSGCYFQSERISGHKNAHLALRGFRDS